jgi:hypothetical protein
MSISIFMLSLLVTFGLTTTSAQAEERLLFRATFSGTFVKTQFDTNGDGAPANLNFLEGESNLGQFSLQVLDESVLAEPTTCPNGHPGFSVTLVTGSAVFRFRGTGDLLFVQPTSQTTCFDPSTAVGFFRAAIGEISGGTGRFVNATGTVEGEGMSRILITDPAGNFFAEQHGTMEGTIILP